jgi:hypothetical protein
MKVLKKYISVMSYVFSVDVLKENLGFLAYL